MGKPVQDVYYRGGGKTGGKGPHCRIPRQFKPHGYSRVPHLKRGRKTHRIHIGDFRIQQARERGVQGYCRRFSIRACFGGKYDAALFRRNRDYKAREHKGFDNRGGVNALLRVPRAGDAPVKNKGQRLECFKGIQDVRFKRIQKLVNKGGKTRKLAAEEPGRN